MNEQKNTNLPICRQSVVVLGCLETKRLEIIASPPTKKAFFEYWLGEVLKSIAISKLWRNQTNLALFSSMLTLRGNTQRNIVQISISKMLRRQIMIKKIIARENLNTIELRCFRPSAGCVMTESSWASTMVALSISSFCLTIAS